MLRRHGDVGAETLAASLEHRVVIRGEAHLDSGGQNMYTILVHILAMPGKKCYLNGSREQGSHQLVRQGERR